MISALRTTVTSAGFFASIAGKRLTASESNSKSKNVHLQNNCCYVALMALITFVLSDSSYLPCAIILVVMILETVACG